MRFPFITFILRRSLIVVISKEASGIIKIKLVSRFSCQTVCALVWMLSSEGASMLSITLEPQYEEEWLGENPSPTTFPSHPLYHQWLTYKAESPLIINAYNTGTGKTKAAFLRLLKRAQ